MLHLLLLIFISWKALKGMVRIYYVKGSNYIKLKVFLEQDVFEVGFLGQ